MCKVSIITVCYNAGHTIEQTMKSVLGQSFADFEYIVIDGKSVDNTMQIVSEYKTKFAKADLAMTVLSEEDSGIFNAMNKSIPLAKGEWILFLNADDYLCDSDVLMNIAPELNLDFYDVVYGDTIHKSNGMYKYGKSDSIKEITTHMICTHQSIFISRQCMNDFLYDEKYKIAADYNFIIKLYLASYRFNKVNFPIVVFSMEGISSHKSYYKKKELEIIDIHYCNGVIDENERDKRIKKIKKDAFLRSIKNKIKAITPKPILLKRKERYYKIDGWSEQFPVY